MLKLEADVRYETLLHSCLGDERMHGRLLETFSLLESIGAQKIHLYISRSGLNEEILQHAAEEARHAWFFKRAARRVLGMEGGAGLGFAPIASKQYLTRIEVEVVRFLRGEGVTLKRDLRRLSYLLVTLLIEIRATALYTSYERSLRSLGHGLTLKAVLGEEEKHLKDIVESLLAEFGNEDAARIVRVLQGKEEVIFASWLRSVESEIKRIRPSAIGPEAAYA